MKVRSRTHRIYVGSKLTLTRDRTGLRMIKLIQLVLVQKLEGEYKPTDGTALKMPVLAGQLLVKGDCDWVVQEADAKMYWSATGTCMYMMQWSHQNIFNAVHRLARHMTALHLSTYDPHQVCDIH